MLCLGFVPRFLCSFHTAIPFALHIAYGNKVCRVHTCAAFPGDPTAAAAPAAAAAGSPPVTLGLRASRAAAAAAHCSGGAADNPHDGGRFPSTKAFILAGTGVECAAGPAPVSFVIGARALRPSMVPAAGRLGRQGVAAGGGRTSVFAARPRGRHTLLLGCCAAEGRFGLMCSAAAAVGHHHLRRRDFIDTT